MPRRRHRFGLLCPPRAGVATRPAWPGVDAKRLPPNSGHEIVEHVEQVDPADDYAAKALACGTPGFIRALRLVKFAGSRGWRDVFEAVRCGISRHSDVLPCGEDIRRPLIQPAAPGERLEKPSGPNAGQVPEAA
jgi:hypothetical protein